MIEVIAKLWAEGRSLSAIADELRFSRGVLAGRIHRARKGGDPRFPSRPAPLKKAVVARPRSRGKHPTVTPPPPGCEPPMGRKLVVDLPADGCRYPSREADDGRHLFCGRPRARGRPYCRWCDEKLAKRQPFADSSVSSSPRAPGPPR